MKKITTILLFLFAFTNGKAQCNASFTYTVGANGQVSFTSTSTGSSSSNYYSWSFGDNSANPSYTYIYNGTYYVSLTFYNGDSLNTCTSSFTDSIIITNATPCNLQAGFTYTLGANGGVNFTNTTRGGDPSTYYSWHHTINNSNIGDTMGYNNPTSFTYNFLYNGTYTITLDAYNTDGACSSTYTSVIVISNAPCQTTQVAFTYTLGSNGQVSFTNTSINLPGNPVYSWALGNGISSNLSTPLSYTYPYNGNYNVCLTITDGANSMCSPSTTCNNVMVTNSNPCAPPQINFTMTRDSSAGLGVWNAVVTYSNVQYIQWLWGDGTSDGGFVPFTPSHTYTASGAYQICVNAWNDTTCYDSVYVCQNDSLYRLQQSSQNMISVQVVDASQTTGVQQISNSTKVNLYPNPASNAITLQASNEIGTISIYNTIGELVLQTQTKEKSIQLDISRLTSGIYMVNALGKYSKFMKQ